jgi:hypothetical protein
MKSRDTSTLSISYDSQLMQEYLQSAGILINNAPGTIASFQNADGQAEAIVIDASDGQPYHVCREPLSDSGWNMYGLGAGFRWFSARAAKTVYATGADGNLWESNAGRWYQFRGNLPGNNAFTLISAASDATVWALDPNGQLYAKGRAAARSGIQAPPQIDASKTPVVIADGNACMHYFCIDNKGALWTIQQINPDAAWSRWKQFESAGTELQSLAAAVDAQGRPCVFAIGADGCMYSRLQQTAGGNFWSAWNKTAPSTANPFVSLTVSIGADRLLHVFCLDNQSDVYRMDQTAAGTNWAPWASLGSPTSGVQKLALALDSESRLLVFTCTETAVFHNDQISASNISGWSGWKQLPEVPGSIVFSIAVATCPDGNVEVFALGELGIYGQTAFFLRQASGAWQGTWNNVGYQFFVSASLVMGVNANGMLELFALDREESPRQPSRGLFHAWQQSLGGEWSWGYLGSPNDVLETFAVARGAAGKLEVFASGASGGNYTIAQNTTHNTQTGWSDWLQDWWTWFPVPNAPLLMSAPCGSSAQNYAIDKSNSLWQCSQGVWSTISLPNNAPAAYVAPDRDGTLWVLDAAGNLFHGPAGDLAAMPVAALANANSLSGNSGTNLWATALTDANATTYTLFRYAQNEWQQVNTPPLQWWRSYPAISTGYDGSVWLLDGKVGAIWGAQLRDECWSWLAEPATEAAPLATMTAGWNGSAWAVDANGAAWEFSSEWMSSPQTLPNGAKLKEISAGSGAALWAIDANGNAYQKVQSATTNTGEWQSAAGLSEPLLHAPNAWAITSTGRLYQYSENGWTEFAQTFSAAPATVSTASDGSVWMLDASGGLWQLGRNQFEAVAGAPAGIEQLAARSADALWVVAGGSFYLYTRGQWRNIGGLGPNVAGQAKPMLSSAPDGTVWMVDGSGRPQRLIWNAPRESWSTQGSGFGFRSICAANVNQNSYSTAQVHTAWAVSEEGIFWRHSPGGWRNAEVPLPFGASAAQVSVDTDGAMWATDLQGRLYSRQAWTSSEPSPNTGTRALPAAFRDSAGLLQFMCLDQSGALWAGAQSADGTFGAPNGAAWAQAGTPLDDLDGFLLTADKSGALQLFVYGDPSGQVYYFTQSGVNQGGWANPSSISQAGIPGHFQPRQFAVTRNGQDLPVLVGIGTGGPYVIHMWQTSAGQWPNWNTLPQIPGAQTLDAIALGKDAAGHLYCCVSSAGSLFVNANPSDAPNGWSSAWLELAGKPAGATSITQLAFVNNGGALCLFAIATDSSGDSEIFQAELQPGSTSSWSSLVSLGAPGGPACDQLQATNDAEGNALVVVHTRDGALYQCLVQEPTALAPEWKALASFGTRGVPFRSFGLASDGSGQVQTIFAVSDGAVWLANPSTRSSTGWGSWCSLNGPQSWRPVAAAPPSLAQAPVGGSTTALWTIDTSGTLFQSTDQGQTWRKFPFASAVSSVSAGIDGSIWAITNPPQNQTASSLYVLVSNVFEKLWDGDFIQAPVGEAAAMWTIDVDGAQNILRSTQAGHSWWKDKSIPARVTQISVCAEGSVWAIDESGNAYFCQAWQRLIQPTRMPGIAVNGGFREVVAGTNPFVNRYAFLADHSGQVYYSCEVFHHTWSDLTSVNGMMVNAPLGLTNQQDTNELIAYGSDGTMIHVARQPAKQYSEFEQNDVPVWMSDRIVSGCTDVELAAIDDQHWYWFGFFSYGMLNASCVPAGQPLMLEQLGPPNVNSIVRVPWKRSPANPWLAALDGNGVLHLLSSEWNGSFCTGFNDTPLTGNGKLLPQRIQSAAAVLQADELGPMQMRFYASDASGALWIIRRFDPFAAGTSAAAWTSWVPLGNGFLNLAPGPSHSATDTLFAYQPATQSLECIRQNPVTGKWTSGEVKRPSNSGTEIAAVPMYYTDITVTDEWGAARPGIALTITCDTPVTALIAGVTQELTATRGIVCQTNSLGKITIRTFAEDLHAPSLTIAVSTANGASAGTSTTINPSAHIYNFLAGTENLPVNKGQPVPFTANTLTQASTFSVNPQNASSAVSTIQQVTALPNKTARLTRTSRGLIRLGAREGATLGWSWNIWDDITHVADDVVHTVVAGVGDVANIAIDAAQKTVTITLTLANGVQTAFNFVVKTVKDAAMAIAVVVKQLVADIKLFIEWLMLLLDWEKILETQKMLIEFMQKLVNFGESAVQTAIAKVGQVFDQIEENLDQAIQQAISKIGTQYSSLGNLPLKYPANSPQASAVRRLAASGSPGNWGQLPTGSSSSQLMWLFNKATDFIGPGLDFGSIEAYVNPSSFLQSFGGNNILIQLNDAVMAFWNGLKQSLGDPAELLNIALSTVLQLAGDLVNASLAFLQDFIQGMLALANSMLQGFWATLNHDLDIPFIDTLFGWITGGEDLTVLNLVSLMTAAPIYLLHVLLFDCAPFSGMSSDKARPLSPASAKAEDDVNEWARGYLVLGFVNSFLGGMHDLFAISAGADNESHTTISNLASAFGDFVSLSMLPCAWPDPAGNWETSGWSATPLGVFAWANWALYGLLPLYDWVALRFFASGNTGLSDIEPFVATGLGGLVEATAVVQIGLDSSMNVPEGVQLICGPFGMLLQFVMFSAIRKAITASDFGIDPGYVVLAVDGVVNLAVPILDQFASYEAAERKASAVAME